MKRLDKTRFSQQKDDGKYKGEELTKFFEKHPDFRVYSFTRQRPQKQYQKNHKVVIESHRSIDGNSFIKEVTDKFKDRDFYVHVQKYEEKYEEEDEYSIKKRIITLESVDVTYNFNYMKEIEEYNTAKRHHFELEEQYYAARKKDLAAYKEEYFAYVKGLRQERSVNSIDSAQL